MSKPTRFESSHPLFRRVPHDGLRFSGMEDGIVFDINGFGHLYRLGWPISADDAWLARDVNGDGTINNGSELFGSATLLSSGVVARHGYEALADLDTNGDGRLDEADPAFGELLLWRDTTRNGLSESHELTRLSDAGVVRLSLDFRESRRRDAWGNVFRYRSEVEFLANPQKRFAYDVFPVYSLISAPSCSQE